MVQSPDKHRHEPLGLAKQSGENAAKRQRDERERASRLDGRARALEACPPDKKALQHYRRTDSPASPQKPLAATGQSLMGETRL